METEFNWTRVNNDENGNPRYVCHYLNIASTYKEALSIAKGYGGRKFHNRQYGGGIIFQTYGLRDLEERLIEASPKHRRARYEEAIRLVNEMEFGWFIAPLDKDRYILGGIGFGRAADHLFDLAINTDESVYHDAIKALCAGDKTYAKAIKLSVGTYRYDKIMNND